MVNNGLPDGVKFKSIKPGTVVLVSWDDSDDMKMLIIENCDDYRNASYKGPVSYKVMCAEGRTNTADGEQIVQVLEHNALKRIL